MARTELQAAIVETIRQSLPKGLTIRGGPRQSFYKAGIYARYPQDKGRGYYFIAKILIRPNGIIRGTIGKGRKVNRKNHIQKE